MLQRVNTSLTMNHTLLNSIAFGALGKEQCFVMIGIAVWDLESTRSSKIHLFSISSKLVSPLWVSLTSCKPLSHLTRDGRLLWYLIQHLFSNPIAPHLTRIRLKGKSQHKVYEISFPYLCSYVSRKQRGDKTYLAINKNEETRRIAVKVFSGPVQHKNFEVESSALRDVKPSYFHVSWSPSPPSLSLPPLSPTLVGKDVMLRMSLMKWKGWPCPQPEDWCGFVMMDVGENLPKLNREVFELMKSSLEEIHKEGWVHCDC
jgi:hypothetical protein